MFLGNKLTIKVVWAAALSVSLLTMLQSHAQAIETDNTASANETKAKVAAERNQGLLEELVVTAKKRSQSLQDTPLSITALSAGQLQQVGATNNYDVALLTPNFSTNQQLGRRLDRPVIRGQSAPAVGGEPNASYFIDGVFVSGSISSATLGPIEQVEILRGPQSAQFGRATFAGAVNYITRKPTNEFEGEVRGVTATNNTRQVNGWISGPIVEDKLTYFLAAGYDQYGGEWYNDLKANQAPGANFIDPPQFADNSKLGGTKTRDFAGKLLWNASDTTEIGLKLGYTEGKDDHYAQLILEPGELNCYLPTNGSGNTVDNTGQPWYNTSQGAYCGEIDINRVGYNSQNPFAGQYISGTPLNGEARQSRFNLPDFREGMTFINASDPTLTAEPTRPGSDRKTKRSLLTIDQGIGDWELTGRLAYNTDSFRAAYDLDQRERRPIGGVFTMEERVEVKDKSFELILSSPQDFSVRGSLGIYAFNADQENTARRYVGYWGFSSGSGLGQFEDPLLQEIRNRSVFGSVDLDILPELTLSLEARYANDQKSIESPYYCDDPSNKFNGQKLEDSSDNNALTPRATLTWTVSDDAMFYVLASKGNKPAEFNSAYFRATVQANPCATLEARAAGLTQTKEETAWTYEGGTKTTWLGGRALVNMSVFFIEWTNQTVFET
ncbi:MAG: TonB-dependent receptor, partial [Gammaproteobacteria bacterium]|nr:TonB-dependent receptor [Gammaproteobacteria bacterium]